LIRTKAEERVQKDKEGSERKKEARRTDGIELLILSSTFGE
jgi:hypothetical protein